MPEAYAPHAARRFDVVFCDIDGCLMPEESQAADVEALATVAEYNRRALDRADRPVIVPCTGRPQPYAEAVCRLLGCSALPAICENGVWLYDFAGHRWQMHPAISRDDIACVQALERWITDNLGPAGCYLQLGKSAAITVFHEDVAWLTSDVQPRLLDLIRSRGWPIRVSMTWTCINCDLVHISKGSAIRHVMDRFGLDAGRVAGIGDTLGDLAIRECVAWFGCPANADDRLKPHADVIAPEPLARGVVHLLDHLVG